MRQLEEDNLILRFCRDVASGDDTSKHCSPRYWCSGALEAKAGLLNKSSCLAPALGVTKFIIVTDMVLVTLCCATWVALRCSTNQPLKLICWTTKSDLSSTIKCDQFITITTMNLVTPKAAVKYEHLFNKRAFSIKHYTGQFVEQTLVLSCCFRCDQIHSSDIYESGHTLLSYLSRT